MKINKLFKKLLIAAGALMVWEVGVTWWEKSRFARGMDYWQVYYDQPTVDFVVNNRQIHTIFSTGVNIHLDVYPVDAPNAPVIIFNHGAAGYCRLFAALAQHFNQCGYTVVFPDQRGQGLSDGRRGDYTIAQCTQNIVDAANWAKIRFGGSVFLAGGSVGGALTYYAASAGAPVEAIACLNLFDFGNGLDGFHISRLAPVVQYPTLTVILRTGFKWLKPMYGLRLPFNWFGAFDKLMDIRDTDFQAQWDADPIPPRLISLRSLASNLNTSPRIPFERNQIPILVINQALDQMVAIEVTRNNFTKLTGEKRYLEIPFGHWSSQPEFWNMMVQACDEWFRLYL